MTLKNPIPHSEELLHRIEEALTPHRLPLLIVIDGADGSGKSSLASWLAWQLGMPAIQLASFLVFVKGGFADSSLAPQIVAYQARRQFPGLADFIIDGYVDS